MLYWEEVTMEAAAANIWPWEETKFSPNTLLLLSCWVHLPWNHLFLNFLFYELYRILYLSISLFTPQNILTDIQYQLPLDVPFKRLVFMQLVY